jgi:hypothetical protein
MSERDSGGENQSTAQATIERAEEGKEILGSRVAQGEPGEKQPPHDDPRLSASKTVKKLDEIVKQFEAPTYGGSMERHKQPGNLNPVPPEERTIQRGPLVLQAAATAAGAIGAARDALSTQLEADARLTSDPRYERDQMVYELGQAGKLAGIRPTDAEVEAQVARSGLPPEVADKLPKDAKEQIEQDMPRLEEAQRRPAAVSSTLVQAGQQDSSERNNGLTAEQEGRTGGAAVQRAKASESAQASQANTPGRATNIDQGTSPIKSGSTASAPTDAQDRSTGTGLPPAGEVIK